MKKATDKAAEPEMRVEYDFSRGVRGKYARRYAKGANAVVLEADVAKIFPNAEAVNDSFTRTGGHHPPATQGAGRQVRRMCHGARSRMHVWSSRPTVIRPWPFARCCLDARRECEYRVNKKE